MNYRGVRGGWREIDGRLSASTQRVSSVRAGGEGGGGEETIAEIVPGLFADSRFSAQSSLSALGSARLDNKDAIKPHDGRVSGGDGEG